MAKTMAMICITVVIALAQLAAAANYIVGGPAGGWDISTDFKAWAAAHKFVQGDSLTFKYQLYHNVVEVTEAAYKACSPANAITTDSSGSSTIVLTTPGKRYFICGAPGHCDAGMKLDVDVAPATTLAPPPPQQAKRRWQAPMPVPPPSPAPMPVPPAPAPVAAPPKHAKHKKHRGETMPTFPSGCTCEGPVVESVEADFPLAALAPGTAPPPPPPVSAGGLSAKCGEVAVGLALGGLLVLAM